MAELTNLRFPNPKYSSIATHENDKGQGFLVQVSGSEKSEVEEYIKDLRFYFDTKNNLEEDDDNLGIIVEFTAPQKLPKSNSIEFAFSNETLLRDIQSNGLQIITKESGQPLILSNAFTVGPYESVVANIEVKKGEATFSLWGQNSSGAWIPIPGKSVEINAGGKDTLADDSKSYKDIMLKVKGQPGTIYTVSGSWHII